MEKTRLPKLQLKAPTKFPLATRNGGNRSPPITGVAAPLARAALRRRSKSVTDLRPTATLRKQPTVDKAPQKRPAAAPTDAVKPKVAKKIPDWDYKSRFLDLQGKHNAIKESLKVANEKLRGYNAIESQVEALQAANSLKDAEIKSRNMKISTLEADVAKLKTDLEVSERLTSELSSAKAQLQSAYDALIEDNKTLNQKYSEILIENSQYGSEIRSLKHKIDTLKSCCDDLQASNSQLQSDIDEHEMMRRVLHNKIQDLRGNIRVFCRVRPPVSQDEFERDVCHISSPNESNIEIRKSRESISTINGRPVDLKQEFVFDRVFLGESTQEEVFEELAQLIQSALDGYHVCVFAYGQTGSGKTHTMQGNNNALGMIPRAVEFIFDNIKKLERTHWRYTVKASFLEIYNENIKDLLQPHNKDQTYEIKYNEGRGVTVSNLKIVKIHSAEELKDLMAEANRNRAVAATDFNEHSSRSHAVTKIELEAFNTNTKVSYYGSLNLVDLAGSESAKTSSKDRITETKAINKSLSTLGMVMIALHNKDHHVPYRNSKLTFLLQSCLGGNSKTLMFVNISPFEDCYGESINSLRFAAKVKEIKTVAKKNKIVETPF